MCEEQGVGPEFSTSGLRRWRRGELGLAPVDFLLPGIAGAALRCAARCISSLTCISQVDLVMEQHQAPAQLVGQHPLKPSPVGERQGPV